MLHVLASSRAARLVLSAMTVFVCVLPAWPVAAETASPQQVGNGTPVTFAGTGFTASEALSAWQTAPDGTVIPLPDIRTDPNGAFSIAVSFPANGQWQVTAHSIISGKEAVGQYAVGPTTTTTAATTTNVPVSSPAAAPASSPVPSPAALPGILSVTPSAPPATSLSGPSPTSATVGAPVVFSGTGFTANEPIALSQTGPDGKVTALPGGTADGSGAIATTVSFPGIRQWQVTAHGMFSARDFVGRYVVGTTAGTTAAIPGTLLPPVSSTGTNAPSALPGDTVSAPSPPIVRVK